MKKLLLVAMLLLVTGCSYDYNLTVTNDKRYIEEIEFKFPTSSINLTGKKLKNHVKEEIQKYKKSNIYDAYTFDYKIKKEEVIVTLTAEHKTFELFQASPFYKEYFQRIYKIEGNNYFVSTGGDFTNPNLGEVFDPEYTTKDFSINIKFQNKVASTNANTSDKDKNIYTWNISAKDTNRSVEFSLEDEARYDIIILDFINKNKLVIIPSIIIIVSIVIGGTIVFSRYKLNNRI